MTTETTTTESLFPPFPVPEDLRRAAQEQGWPDDLVQRALNVWIPAKSIEWWLTHDEPTVERIEQLLSQQERLAFGTLRARKATMSAMDNQRFADLWANSPEEIGEWELTVERSPNAFAQFCLQENVNINVLEDQGLFVASDAVSRRNCIVGGKRITVGYSQAVRVRKEFRGKGYSYLVSGGGGGPHPGSPYSNAQYSYFRSQNFAAYNWAKTVNPDLFAHAPEREGAVPGIPVIVLQYPRQPFDGDVTGIRKARRANMRRCVALVNRTHRGLDLFRPYTEVFLQHRLDEGFWAEKPSWWDRLYGWQDYYVLEEEGRIVACAGLWDRGKDMRERWRNESTGEEQVIAATALMDFGHEASQEESMARLVGYLIGETDRLERDYLMAPLEHLPSVAGLLERYEPVPETRGMQWTTFDEDGQPMAVPDPVVSRPYTDLAYW